MKSFPCESGINVHRPKEGNYFGERGTVKKAEKSVEQAKKKLEENRKRKAKIVMRN